MLKELAVLLSIVMVIIACGCIGNSNKELSSEKATEVKLSNAVESSASPYSTDFDLRNMDGFNDNKISAEDIVAFIQKKYPKSPMLDEKDIGDCFISAGKTNDVNPAFLVATACLEGGFGTLGWAASHPECHNTMGYGIPSGSTQPDDFNCIDSWCAMIQRVASVIAHGNNYYAQGRYTVRQVREKYAASPNAESIASLMSELYLSSTNSKEAIQLQASNPSTPMGSATSTLALKKLQEIAVPWAGFGAEDMEFSPDSSKLAVGSGIAAYIWDLTNGVKLETLRNESDGTTMINSISFSPDSSKLALASQYYIASIWDVATGKELQQIRHTDPVREIVFSPDGSKVATRDDTIDVHIWDAATGELFHNLPARANYIDTSFNSIAFNPDGSKLATAGSDSLAHIWDVATGMELQKLVHGGPVFSVTFSPDGSKLATGGEDGAHIWDVATGKELQTLKHDGNVVALVFSPDSSQLATGGSNDYLAHIWDVATGEELHKLKHEGIVNFVAFSPDGNILATSGAGAHIWGVMNGVELQKFKGGLISFSPDGSKIATIGGNNTIEIWGDSNGNYGTPENNAITEEHIQASQASSESIKQNNSNSDTNTKTAYTQDGVNFISRARMEQNINLGSAKSGDYKEVQVSLDTVIVDVAPGEA